MKKTSVCILLVTACAAAPVFADDRESLEVLKQTTVNLIDVLVENGVLTREKADALIKQAERKAATAVAAKAKKERNGTVRVPYVPEIVKNEIRDQIKQEVLAQTKTERWAEPNAIPEWLDRLKWEGDLRLRYQSDLLDKNNAPASDFVQAATIGLPSTTRAADFGTVRGTAATANTEDDRERLRVRARLGLLAKISEDFSGGIRLATGNTTDRVSTNQSLGQNFNKYQLVVDRTYLKYTPTEWLSLSGGRIPNPWFSTDLVWDDDLNFEGFAATLAERNNRAAFQPFLTVGAFPIREENPPTRSDRWLHGAQTGFQWSLGSSTRLKFGAAYYGYRGVEGRPEDANSFIGGVQRNANYGQHEYEAGLRQKGNTLFLTNAVTDPNFATTPLWGLASRFRNINLTTAIDLAHWDPMHVTVVADYVKNIGFDRSEIFSRTGLTNAEFPDGRDKGFLLKLQLGKLQIKERQDWNAFVAYRYLGSDAVLDAFTDSDFGLGGTNTKGYQLGFNYGIDRNVNLGLKWMSADAIDSFIPISQQAGLGFSAAKSRFSVDLLQIDLSARF